MVSAVVEDTLGWPYGSVLWPSSFEVMPEVGNIITGTSSYLSGSRRVRARVTGIEHRQSRLHGSYACVLVEQLC